MGHRRFGGESARKVGRLALVTALAGALLVVSPLPALADDPEAFDDSATVVQGGTVTVLDGGAASVKANDTDTEDGIPGGDVTLGTGPANADAFSLATDGTFSYTHNGLTTDPDSFTYTVEDSAGTDSNIATVTITITAPANDPPEANGDSATVVQGGTVTVLDGGAASVKANDTDTEDGIPGGDVTLGAGPANADAFSLATDGTFSYTHNGLTTDPDSFTYTVKDSAGTDSNIATVTITITAPANDPPEANGDSATVAEGGTITTLDGGAGSVKANDTDTEDGIPGGDVTLGTGPANAAAFSLATDGTFSYTHNGTETTSDSFTYTVKDSAGVDSNTATVDITISPFDDPPTINSGTGTFSIPESAAVGTSVTTVAATDPDSPGIVYSIAAGPGSADFLIGSTSGVTSTAAPLDRETRASYSLTVVASAGGKSDSGTVVVNVTNVNEPPMVTVPTGTVVAGEDAPFTPVIRFTDPDTADTHTYSIDWGDGTAPSTGVALSPLGVSHTYAANDTFTVTVTVTDAGARSDTKSFDVEVVDDPIDMTAGPAETFTEGSAVTITASFTDDAAPTHAATVDWGDGTPVSATGVTIDQTADTVSATHTYDTKGDADGETDYVPTIRLTRTTGSGVGTASVPVKMMNSAPTIGKFLITDGNDVPKTTFARGETTKVNIDITDPGADDTLEVRVSWQDGTPDFLKTVAGTGAAKRTVVATHKYTDTAPQTITAIINDGEGGTVSKDAATIFIVPGGGAQLETVGLVDPTTGFWNLRNSGGQVTSFFYGNPGDFPIIGDWDCDGDETPGMYRQSDGFVYLRNTNTQGVADIKFFFGNPGDVPIVGDTDGDGCDTVSIYRPSLSKVFVINKLGQNNGGLGAAELEYFFGNPGDKPFVGDFNGNGVETIGLHRESTGLVYFRNSHTQGVADNEFIFGDPGDRLVAGDWVQTGINSPAVFRPGNTTFYFRHSNTQGNADNQFVWGDTPDLPVAGNFGLG